MVILMTLPLVINNKGTKTVNKIPPNGKTLFPGKNMAINNNIGANMFTTAHSSDLKQGSANQYR